MRAIRVKVQRYEGWLKELLLEWRRRRQEKILHYKRRLRWMLILWSDILWSESLITLADLILKEEEKRETTPVRVSRPPVTKVPVRDRHNVVKVGKVLVIDCTNFAVLVRTDLRVVDVFGESTSVSCKYETETTVITVGFRTDKSWISFTRSEQSTDEVGLTKVSGSPSEGWLFEFDGGFSVEIFDRYDAVLKQTDRRVIATGIAICGFLKGTWETRGRETKEVVGIEEIVVATVLPAPISAPPAQEPEVTIVVQTPNQIM